MCLCKSQMPKYYFSLKLLLQCCKKFQFDYDAEFIASIEKIKNRKKVQLANHLESKTR